MRRLDEWKLEIQNKIETAGRRLGKQTFHLNDSDHKILTLIARVEKLETMLYDVSEIAKYLSWRSQPGYKAAQEIIDQVHRGKWGDNQGIWVQVSEALAEDSLEDTAEKN